MIAVLAAFMAGCYLLDLNEQPEVVNPLPGYPVSAVPDQPAKTIEPVSFYLADGYDPAETDTGKTAFALAETSFSRGGNALPNFMAVSEEQENGAIVRFFDTGNSLAASVYFADNSMFPNGFLLNLGEDGIAHGTFSDYNKSEETFSLTLRYEGEPRVFEKLVLNKNVFRVYQDDTDLPDGQNSRIRNCIATMSVWAAMAIRFNAELDAENAPEESASTSDVSESSGISKFSDGSTLFDGIEEDMRKVVESVCLIGKPVETFLAAIYGKTEAIAKAGTAINAKTGAPRKIAVSVTEPVITTVVPSDDEEPDGEDEVAEEKRKAPRFTIYYYPDYPDSQDKPEEKQYIPVLKEDESPGIGQEFYIKPHDQPDAVTAVTSNIRFYFEAAASEEIEVKTNRDFSPLNFLYHPVNVKKDGEVYYFEVKKANGFVGDYKKTTLTIKPYNGADPEHPADFSYYYVNGREFSGEEGFAINFFDAPSHPEQDEVLTPQKFETDSSAVSNFVPFNPARYIVPDEEYFALAE
jgi:hypothetical protein